MADLWPHENGSVWTYDLYNSVLSESDLEVHADSNDVPPFDLDDLYAKLQQSVDTEHTLLGIYRLEFDGMITTGYGVTAQKLVATVFEDSNPVGHSESGFRRIDAFTEFLFMLMRARPDLNDKISAILRARGVLSSALIRPQSCCLDPLLFLNGYAWELNADAIIGHGDFSTEASWKYLEKDLTIGHSFVLQLVPDLTNDIFLHGKVMSRKTVEIGGQEFENSIECFYAIDFGVQPVTNESGPVIGYIRPGDYGTIWYAPGVGPVSSLERFIGIAVQGNQEIPYNQERGVSLIEFNPGE